VAAVIVELSKIVDMGNARINNIYQIDPKTIVLKIKNPGMQAINLLVEAGKRMHLTSYQIEKPLKPPPLTLISMFTGKEVTTKSSPGILSITASGSLISWRNTEKPCVVTQQPPVMWKSAGSAGSVGMKRMNSRYPDPKARR